MKLVKAIATVGGLTGLSRIAGFVRDILTATILGAGPIADAFFVALKLPNFFRRVTAEGAFSVSFLPLYTEALEKDGEEMARNFANNIFTLMCLILLLFTVTAIIFMPWIIMGIAPGFTGDEIRYPLAVELSQVTFPYLLLMSLTALAGGILNAHDRFAPFAAAPILFNFALIIALLNAEYFETAGHALAWGVLFAGVLQIGFLFICLKKAKRLVRFQRPEFSKRTRKLFKLMGPGVIGAGVVHINLFADLIIASFLDAGSISHLYYADRLNQLPLGIVGIAIGTALLPMLSKAVAAGDKQQSQTLFNRSIEICLLLTLPAAAGLFFAATPIITTLFEHGAFDGSDTRATASILSAYAVGLPAYVITKVYAATFWSNQDTTTPVLISIVATLTNIALSLVFIFTFDMGVAGIAIATSIAGWLQLILYHLLSSKKSDLFFDQKLKQAIVKITASVVTMSALLFTAVYFVTPVFYSEGAQINLHIAGLTLIITSAALAYCVMLFVTRALSLSELKRYLTR